MELKEDSETVLEEIKSANPLHGVESTTYLLAVLATASANPLHGVERGDISDAMPPTAPTTRIHYMELKATTSTPGTHSYTQYPGIHYMELKVYYSNAGVAVAF